MYDLYVPLTENFDMEIPYEKAQEIILEALKPLGEEYLENVKKAFAEGWIDVYEMKENKEELILGAATILNHIYCLATKMI